VVGDCTLRATAMEGLAARDFKPAIEDLVAPRRQQIGDWS